MNSTRSVKIWKVHPLHDRAHEIARSAKIHPIVASFLLHQGLSSAEAIDQHLHPAVHSIKDPMRMPGMAEAVSILRDAVSRRQRILVYGDYDVDGVTASSILAPALKRLGADVSVHLPHRIKEGYGLNIDSLREWIQKGVQVVVTVDNGITSFDAVRFLKSQGVRVVIVDHHLPKTDFPPADAIVSGALSPEEPDAELAACGLAFKVAWALHGGFDKVKEWMDLVTVGTVADLAPVTGENRILLKIGLPMLAKTMRHGLRAMMESAKIHPYFLGYRDIAFGFGPRINAAGRMGHPMDAYKLLTTENAAEARNLAQILEEGNRQRQKVEEEAFRQASAKVEQMDSRSKKRVLVVEDESWHEGVLGIVASRLVEKYGIPSIVISLRGGIGKGSGRSVADVHLFKIIQPFEKELVGFGGHAQACGLSIHRDNIERFRAMLNEFDDSGEAVSVGAGGDFWLDAELGAEDLNPAFLAQLQKLAPHGPGSPAPRFLSRAMRVKGQPQRRGKDTLSVWLTDSENRVTCEAVAFRSFERWTKEMAGKQCLDIAYQPVLRSINGIASIQLELISWRQA